MKPKVGGAGAKAKLAAAGWFRNPVVAAGFLRTAHLALAALGGGGGGTFIVLQNGRAAFTGEGEREGEGDSMSTSSESSAPKNILKEK